MSRTCGFRGHCFDVLSLHEDLRDAELQVRLQHKEILELQKSQDCFGNWLRERAERRSREIWE